MPLNLWLPELQIIIIIIHVYNAPTDVNSEGFTISYTGGTVIRSCSGGISSTVVFECDPSARWDQLEEGNMTQYVRSVVPNTTQCMVSPYTTLNCRTVMGGFEWVWFLGTPVIWWSMWFWSVNSLCLYVHLSYCCFVRMKKKKHYYSLCLYRSQSRWDTVVLASHLVSFTHGFTHVSSPSLAPKNFFPLLLLFHIHSYTRSYHCWYSSCWYIATGFCDCRNYHCCCHL